MSYFKAKNSIVSVIQLSLFSYSYVFSTEWEQGFVWKKKFLNSLRLESSENLEKQNYIPDQRPILPSQVYYLNFFKWLILK